jgi:hypothetical protein
LASLLGGVQTFAGELEQDTALALKNQLKRLSIEELMKFSEALKSNNSSNLEDKLKVLGHMCYGERMTMLNDLATSYTNAVNSAKNLLVFGVLKHTLSNPGFSYKNFTAMIEATLEFKAGQACGSAGASSGQPVPNPPVETDQVTESLGRLSM